MYPPGPDPAPPWPGAAASIARRGHDAVGVKSGSTSTTQARIGDTLRVTQTAAGGSRFASALLGHG